MSSKRHVVHITPWQRKIYEHHRSKVKNATSVVDVLPPKSRPHIVFDAKKIQYERERREQIIRDNFVLLNKLHTIMQKRGITGKQKRSDNPKKTTEPRYC